MRKSDPRPFLNEHDNIFDYWLETRTLNKKERDWLKDFKMRTWCNIENISWNDCIINEYVYDLIKEKKNKNCINKY